ncbi:class I SAM-dependent methyltransferase [Luteipulveratus mongoliensis]|uniref:Methyltransferase domain-containing protein n=1 Tax=Luteipulveratus mongoliensis TaxID=571913 RepID=A0A0K1JHV9_9MICO|nr:class I SAM-dependent methyltransferase [Luteipulveratus mongoliensis]AKU16178.1 hypothetical protein VV02_10390 [Luteipulveratus mongoliensis]
MTQQTTLDHELKARHRAMWASGDYSAVAGDVIPDLGRVLVQALEIRVGDHVLDVAAGTGNAAIPAALEGGRVVATDLTPELLEIGAKEAAAQGAVLTWSEADAESLPFEDGEFDTVMSCVGVMFAPHHQDSADELVRVLRPGGSLGLVSWTPQGFIGQLFAALKPYAPAPPPGAQPPPLWGDEAHVRGLLGDRVTDVSARKELLEVTCFARPEEFRDFFKAAYGPTIAVYTSLGDDADRIAALDQALVDLAAQHDLGNGRMQWEYLLLTARRS